MFKQDADAIFACKEDAIHAMLILLNMQFELV